MSKKGKASKLATKMLEEAIAKKPIAYCDFTQKRLDNFRLKLEDLEVGRHLRIEPSQEFYNRILIFVLNRWAIDLLLHSVRGGTLKAYKEDIRFDEQMLALYNNCEKALEIYQQSKQRGTGLQQTQ